MNQAVRANSTRVPKDAIRGWHFLHANKRLAVYEFSTAHYDTGPFVRKGDIFYVDDAPCPCNTGLHASMQLSDAINYAPGSVLCRVDSWGDVQTEADKLASHYRRVRWMVQLSAEFLREMCLAVIENCARYKLRRTKSFQRVLTAVKTGSPVVAQQALYAQHCSGAAERLFRGFLNAPNLLKFLGYMADGNYFDCVNTPAVRRFIDTIMAKQIEAMVKKP